MSAASLPPAPLGSFASDNAAGVSPEVMEALAAANHGPALAYGQDRWTDDAVARIRDLFDAPVEVVMCWGGTGANVVGLATLLQPWQSVLCTDTAHIVVDECGAPMISIAGGEPLIHPQIDRIVEGLIERGKFVTLCTNAILLERWLPKFTPSDHFSFTIHLDGMRDLHDAMVGRKGIFDKAVKGIREAKALGFRVNTNTTVFADSSTEEMRELFNFLADDLKTDATKVHGCLDAVGPGVVLVTVNNALEKAGKILILAGFEIKVPSIRTLGAFS